MFVAQVRSAVVREGDDAHLVRERELGKETAGFGTPATNPALVPGAREEVPVGEIAAPWLHARCPAMSWIRLHVAVLNVRIS
ncbi:MAG: hypothetical protein PHU43_02610 [Candidatus Bipolaricaulis sp.]|nr:hypothetical protein [Candidatus Bipolaricaulis sp.]